MCIRDRHSGAPENKKRGIDPDAVIPGAYSLNNAIENVLSQPVGLGIGAVNIDLSAVDFGICVGIAVNADKIISGPGICHIDPLLQASRCV